MGFMEVGDGDGKMHLYVAMKSEVAGGGLKTVSWRWMGG